MTKHLLNTLKARYGSSENSGKRQPSNVERNAERYWSSLLEKLRLISPVDVKCGFAGFFAFISASILITYLSQTNFALTVALSIGLFSSGLFFLSYIILRAVYTLDSYTEVSDPKEGDGNLWVKSVADKTFEELDKQIQIKIGDAERILVVAAFQGHATNAFYDALLFYRLGPSIEGRVWVPDPSTYLSPIRYTPVGIDSIERARVTVNPLIDTGLIQGDCRYDDTLARLEYSLVSVPSEDPREYVLPRGARVFRIRLTIYEDPVFAPSPETRGGIDTENPEESRRAIDTVQIELI